ncbi:MAG: cell division protein FtsI/penicillin-binding protein 2, partial [Crocinitomicaceae bacterium]
MKKDEKQFLMRLRVIFGAIVTVGFVLIANLFHIQISLGNQFRAQADGQYVVATYNSFERGSIFFEQRDGTRISAAGQRSGYKISINPSTFSEDKNKLFDNLQSVINIDREKFFSSLEKKERSYVEIANQVSKNDG